MHRDRQPDARTRHRLDDQGSERDADQSSHKRNGDRFAQEQLEDVFPSEAQRAEDGNFAGAFADRHRHGVGADQQRGKDNGSADAEYEYFDAAKSVDEIEFERLFALALGGDRSAVEHVVDGVGHSGHVFRRVDASEEKAGCAFEKADRFFHVCGVQVERTVRRVDGVNAAQGQVQIRGEDAALQDDVVADFPVVFPGKFNVDDAAGAVALPGGELVGGHDLVGGDVEVFVGIGSELGEIVFRLVVLILAAEPGHGDDVHDSGNRADLFPIVDGKEVGKRDLVTGHDAKRGVRRSLVDIEAAPDAKHDAEQEERESDAGDRQQTAPLVAKGGLGDETGEGHGSDNILHGGTQSRRRTTRLSKLFFRNQLLHFEIHPLRDRAIFFFLSQFVGDDYLHSVISWRELGTEANEAASGQMKKVGLAVEIQRRGGVRIEMLAIAKEPNLLEYLRWIAWRVLGVQYFINISDLRSGPEDTDRRISLCIECLCLIVGKRTGRSSQIRRLATQDARDRQMTFLRVRPVKMLARRSQFLRGGVAHHQPDLIRTRLLDQVLLAEDKTVFKNAVVILVFDAKSVGEVTTGHDLSIVAKDCRNQIDSPLVATVRFVGECNVPGLGMEEGGDERPLGLIGEYCGEPQVNVGSREWRG